MSRKSRAFILTGTSLAILACATSVVLIARATSRPAVVVTTDPPQTRTTAGRKNLSLQPEAARVNRRLGNRFNSSVQSDTTMTGVLTIGKTQQTVTINRRQEQSGELVELVLPNSRFTWNAREGIKAGSGSLSQVDRLFVERLIFDAADQFVLAQLRGASYYTVATNQRPDDAGEAYAGPLWNVVRVSEPQSGSDTAPSSAWRLFYINTSTDLIDRIVCELDGRTVEATIQWTEESGEKIPTHLKWTTQGGTLMEYEVTAFRQNK